MIYQMLKFAVAGFAYRCLNMCIRSSWFPWFVIFFSINEAYIVLTLQINHF